MLVRTFQANEMSEALRMVKAEMGLDAMILSSKKERKKGILGFFSKPYFEVTAALEPRPVARPNPYREEPEPPARELSTKEEFQNSMLGPLAREVRDLKQRVEALSKKDAQVAQVAPSTSPQSPDAVEAAPRNFAKEELDEIKKLLYSAVAGKNEPKTITFPNADAVAPAAGDTDEMQLMRQQLGSLQMPNITEAAAPVATPQATSLQAAPLADLKELIKQQLRDQAPLPALEEDAAEPMLQAEPAAEAGPLAQLGRELAHEELSPEVVEMLLGQLKEAAKEGMGLKELRAQLSENLSNQVKCSGTLRMKKNGPRIMAIVGPTGVGKTTTIAKLAAMHALNRGASVAMVTTDNFRVGAIEQLKTYAKIMDLPLEVAATPADLAKVLARHADKDLILIDTTGRSHKDAERLEDLKGFLECHPGIETYLCMSATTRARELDEIVATFGGLPITKFLFTKLDESESYGCIVNTHLKHKLPISYLTTGQKVPEDIEVASAKKIASLVVKESAR
jgi:flagellar biosynthesis protein FlhF